MKHRITRRAMLSLLPGSLAAQTSQSRKAKQLPRMGEFVRLLDPATEGVVVRLTALTSTSLLPAPANRFVSARDRFLMFSSNRTGKLAPFQLNLRTGVLRQMAEAVELDPRSVCLDESERFLYFIDRGVLKEVSIANKRTHTVAEDVSAFAMGRPGSSAVIVRGRDLQVLGGSVIARNVRPECLIRPDGSGCFFARDAPTDGVEYWYAAIGNGRGAGGPRLLSKGKISFPFWSPDGEWLLFLRQIETEKAMVSEIRQVHVESLIEQRVAATTQFAVFSPNRNATVFVGASRSKAQPNVILLLRSLKREMTLCEHRAKEPRTVSPVFSPDSGRVYFESDREGKSALYSVNVEGFVEKTAT
ncbi:MAG: PD40 domain-containing protein [Acidobacteriaceae bacterium]|nr:PD40 domain-containing protein [Acidobacteriaceae bacterium]